MIKKLLTALTITIVSLQLWAHNSSGAKYGYAYNPASPSKVAKKSMKSFNSTIPRDILAWCYDLVRQLRTAKRSANSAAHMGNLEKSVKILQKAIKKAKFEIRKGYAPHTVKALRQVRKVAKIVAKFPQYYGDKYTATVVQFIVLQKLVKNVIWAYDQLDDSYYLRVQDTCHGHCDDYDGDFDLPVAYYDGIRRLSKSFVDIYNQTSQRMASDNIELPMAHALSQAAQKILNRSVYRRDFACIATELYEIQAELEEFFSGNSPLPAYDHTRIARTRIGYVSKQLSYRPDCPSYNSGWGH